MNCPKCGRALRVRHTFSGGDSVKTQDSQCTNELCRITVVSVVLIVRAEPERLQGAKSLAAEFSSGRRKLPKFK